MDEYQDLNPVDQQFVDEVIGKGVVTFVAGDDDQSIYSFRYGSPAGIQGFLQRYAGAAGRALSDCFRCAHTITAAANALMNGYPGQNRIPKALNSLYAASAPPVAGVVHRWRFNTAPAEAEAIATSCCDLINGALNPRDILILLSNQRELLPGLRDALNAIAVPFEPPRTESFIGSDTGRFVLAMIRIVCDADDHVAHRLILGLRPGIGLGTCNAVAEGVINNALNYRDIFFNPLPGGVFAGRALAAINHARQVRADISGWQVNDTLQIRLAEISAILNATFNVAEAQNWQAFAANLPQRRNTRRAAGLAVGGYRRTADVRLASHLCAASSTCPKRCGVASSRADYEYARRERIVCTGRLHSRIGGPYFPRPVASAISRSSAGSGSTAIRFNYTRSRRVRPELCHPTAGPSSYTGGCRLSIYHQSERPVLSTSRWASTG